MCVLAVWNKAPAQIISKYELKLRTILQGTESRVEIFYAGMSVMSQQSLSRHTTKGESPTSMKHGSKTPKSNHGSYEDVYGNCLSSSLYLYSSRTKSRCHNTALLHALKHSRVVDINNSSSGIKTVQKYAFIKVKHKLVIYLFMLVIIVVKTCESYL
jgi:hypothetical protein